MVNFMSCILLSKNKQTKKTPYPISKGEILTLDLIKMKNICSAKESDKRMKRGTTDWRNDLQTI